MTNESTTASSSVALSTSGGIITQNTDAVTSPTGADYYVQCAVLVIAIVAMASNGLIVYALVASKQHKKHLLILHQNALDLFASFFMVINYALRICNIYLTGAFGYWLCTLIISGSFNGWGVCTSIINLAIITVERYLKVVHPVWSKNKLRNWMIYSAMAMAWIVSFVSSIVVGIATTGVIDGICYGFMFWASKTANIIYFVWYVLSYYVIILIIFIFCYWHILIVIRRQARVMAGHSAAGSSAAQAQSNQIQTNVIKTMIIVCTFCAVCYLPGYVGFMMINISPVPIPGMEVVYHLSQFLETLYMCANPFIYATKFDPVKQVLLHMIPCKKNSGQGT